MEKKIGVEYIKVYIDFRNGKTVCICKQSNKGCDKPCTPDIVERDKYRDWKDVMKVDKYGRGKD